MTKNIILLLLFVKLETIEKGKIKNPTNDEDFLLE